MDQPESEGVRLVSFDGGDLRAVSQLLILDEFMRRVEWDRNSTARILPCDYFHMMGGVGTGGIIVMLLATLRMGIEEAIEEFINIWTAVFADASLDQAARSAKLEATIKDLLQRRGLPENRKLCNGDGIYSSCKGFVCAVPESNLGMCEKFRSYKSKERSSNPTIIEAIRATCAIPTLFTPVSIESVGCHVSYVTGAYNFNNTTWETIKEACETFGASQLVACMLSLGCGQRPTSRLSQKNEVAVASLVNDIASDSELVDRDLAWRIGKSNVYYRLSVDRVLESGGDFALVSTGEITSFTKVFLEHPTTAEKVNQCTKASESLGRVTLADISGLSEPKPATAHGLPSLSAFFVERPGLIKQMAQCLFRVGPPAQKRIVLSGLGGIGKTQITISFLHQFLSRFHHVLFIDGSSVQSIESGVIAKVKSLGLTYSRTSASEALEVLANPDHEITRDWAIVYDNVDNRDINIADYFPRCSFGTIFITTRNRNLGNLAPNAHLKLDIMSEEEAADVLLRSAFDPSHLITGDDKQHAHEIAKELGYLPVALVQAGYFIKIHNCIHDYRKRLRERRPDILSRPAQDQLDPHYHGVYATLNVTWPHLSSRAQNLMSILGFVNYTGFPLGLLYLAAKRGFLFEPFTLVDRSRRERAFSRDQSSGGNVGVQSSPAQLEDSAKPPHRSGKLRKFPLLLHPAEMWRKYTRSRRGSGLFQQTVQLLCTTFRPEEGSDTQDIDDLVAELERYSLVTRTTTFMVTTLRLHPLVHSWTHDRLPLEDKEVYRAAAVRLLVCGTHSDDADLYEFMYPHVTLMSDRLTDLHVNDQAGLAAVLAHQGDINPAIELWEGIQRKLRVLYGRNDMRCGEADLQLARLYWESGDTGKRQVASVLRGEVIAIRKRTLGSKHPMTMKAIVQLASGMKQKGGDVASILRDAIEFWERQPGDHWETILRVKGELADCCDGEEAIRLCTEVLQARKQRSGPDHHETLKAMENLAWAYVARGSGRDDDEPRRTENSATDIWTLVVAARTHKRGIEHPDTLDAMESLAWSYAWNSTAKSMAQWEEVVRLRKAVQGANHEATLDAMTWLEWSYGRLTFPATREQKELREEIVCGREEIVRLSKEAKGPGHKDTLEAMKTLAITWEKWKNYNKAEEHRKGVVCLTREVHGPSHADIIEAMNALANLYKKWEKYAESEDQWKGIVLLEKKAHSPNHEGTLRAMKGLANLYVVWEKYAESEAQWKEILHFTKEAHALDHEDTLAAMRGLANVYVDWGKYIEAEEQWKEILCLTREKWGPNHKDTLDAMGGLANVYVDWGKYIEAEEQWNEILCLTRETRGSNHKDTLDAMRKLANVYEKWKKYIEAEEQWKEILCLTRETRGSNHKDTLDAMGGLANVYADWGKYIEAEEQWKEILCLTRETRGSNHKDTLDAMRGLANVYEKCERFTEAISQLEGILRFKSDAEGLASSYLICKSMESLAKLYERVGRYDEAVVQGEEIVKLTRDENGPSAWLTLYSMEELAERYERCGQYTEATAQWEEIVHLTKDTNGSSHEDTFEAMARLAEMYERSQQHAKAMAQWEEIVHLTKDENGASHEDTFKAMVKLAEMYERSEQHAKAMAQWEEIVQLTKDVNGASHEDTFYAMDRLAKMYETGEQHAKAAAQWKEMVELEKKSHGLIHLETLHALAQVVRICDNAEAYTEWETQVKEDIRLTREAQGLSHQDTVEAMAGLAKLYQALRKYAEAEGQWKEIICLTKEACGPSSVDTLKAMIGLAETYEASERHTEAIAQLEEIAQLEKDGKTLSAQEMLDVMESLLRLYEECELYTKAVAQQEEIVQLTKEDKGLGFYEWLRSVEYLAEMYMKFERYEDAEALLLDAIDQGRRGGEGEWTMHTLGKLLKEVRSRPARTNDTLSTT